MAINIVFLHNYIHKTITIIKTLLATTELQYYLIQTNHKTLVLQDYIYVSCFAIWTKAHKHKIQLSYNYLTHLLLEMHMAL